MGLRSIVDPRLVGSLASAGHYPQTVTIQAAVRTPDAYGEPVAAWSDRVGLAQLPAAIVPAGGSEPSSGTGVWSITSAKILIAGAYPQIEVADRAVDDAGRVWDIQAVDVGPHGEWTNLAAQIVTVGR